MLAKTRTYPLPEQPPKKPIIKFQLFTIIFVTLVAAVIIFRDGKPELSPERLSKLIRETEQYDNAEQYALKALVAGWYPCSPCDTSHIFLSLNEVWKYGVTVQKQRYTKGWLQAMNLYYEMQYKGDYTECLKREKEKIIRYPLLPEALKRNFIIERPPGNKQSN